ncbi:MAG: hypothetical protein LCI00_24825 [Chloroflexi bacterium]|nr:hypothetical protein [Chloroflexota bacterium]MCC6895789.1 hypothetical protein [Anaerolineae bacterium]
MGSVVRSRWVFVLLVVVFTAGFAHAQDTTTTPDPLASAPRGTVTGKVTNGTAASPAPSNISVTLLVTTENTTVLSMETVTGADGSYQFTDVPIVSGYAYVTAALYRDRIFNSAFVIGDAAAITMTLPINIYELTEDPSVLSISSSGAQVTAQGSTLEVRQVIHFNNSSDRLYTTSTDLGNGRYGSVLISMPPGAQVVSLDNQTRYIESPSDFSVLDTAPVLPGDVHVVVIAYIIPYDGNAALIEQPMNYPFNGQANLLISPTSLGVQSDQLPPNGEKSIDNKAYKNYEAALQLKAGEVIRYEISGAAGDANSVIGVSESNSNVVLVVLVVIIGLGILATIIALVLRGRQNNQAPKPEQLIGALTRQIALLDQKHAAGELPHDLWHQQRRPLQARLDELQGK